MNSLYGASLPEAFPIHELEPPALLLYGAATVAFFLYYLWRYLRKGVFSFDSYFVTMSLYIPIVFMFPFAFSRMNSVMATGAFHNVYLAYLHEAFYIGMFGIALFTVGAFAARFSRAKLVGLGMMSQSFHKFWITRLGVAISIAIILLLLVMMVGLGFEIGNARATSMARPSLRPLYNVFHTLLPFVAVSCFVYAYKRAWAFYPIGVLVALLGAFGGTRSTSIGPLISFAIIVMIVTRYKNFLPLVLLASVVLPLAVYLGGIRHGVYDLSQVSAVPVILLYGNNFSDLRDFAWILSGWDHMLLHGRTQVAGFLSFIPSSLSEFRSTWAWGNFSTTTAGLGEVSDHAGLRPPFFGEFYFNHGLLGVAISSFLTGFVVFKLTAYVHQATERYRANEAVVDVFAAMVYLSLFKAFLITAGFFAFHITVLLILVGMIIFAAVRRHRLALSHA